MNRKMRILILTASVLIFIIAGPILILKSQDIKIDLQQKKLVKTGGFFVQVDNPSAEIYLNGQFKKSTGFFSRTAFIKSLLPREYQVEIKKPDYFTWQKKLSIEEGKVTEIKNVTLFKENYNFSLFLPENTTQDFVFSNDQSQILVKTATSTTWQFQVFNITEQTWQTIFSYKDIKQNIAQPKIEQWNPGNKMILLFQTTTKAKTLYLVNYEISQKPAVFNLSTIIPADQIALNPIEKNSIVFLRKNNIYKQKLGTLNTPEILSNDAIQFETQDNSLFWLTKSGFLVKSDYSGQNKEVLNTKPIVLGAKKEFSVKECSRGVFLNLEGDLLRLNPEQKEFQKLTDGVNSFEVSPDSEKLLYVVNQEVWLFEKNKETKKEGGVFLTRLWQPPASLFWLNDYYFLFNVGNEIKIADIDWRDTINILALKTFKEPRIFLNSSDKKLYILSNGVLYVSEKIMP